MQNTPKLRVAQYNAPLFLFFLGSGTRPISNVSLFVFDLFEIFLKFLIPHMVQFMLIGINTFSTQETIGISWNAVFVVGFTTNTHIFAVVLC